MNNMPDFSRMAASYQQRAVVQQSAGEALLEMLDIKPGEDVLDLVYCFTLNGTFRALPKVAWQGVARRQWPPPCQAPQRSQGAFGRAPFGRDPEQSSAALRVLGIE
jgi:hypothetical protein